MHSTNNAADTPHHVFTRAHFPPLPLPGLQLTPVAKLEPVEIGGVTIQNVSLHNAGHLREMQFGPGDVVAVERAGDVIPQVCTRNDGGDGGGGGVG